MSNEHLHHREQRFDTRRAVLELLAGRPPQHVFGIPPIHVPLGVSYAERSRRLDKNPMHKAIAGTLKTAACFSIAKHIEQSSLPAHSLPSDTTLVTPDVLIKLKKRAAASFRLIYPTIDTMKSHPDHESTFEQILDTLTEYYFDRSTTRNVILESIGREQDTLERLPAYIELLVDVYKRDASALPTVAMVRDLMRSSLSLFSKPTRDNIAYLDAFNDVIDDSYTTEPYSFDPSQCMLSTEHGKPIIILTPKAKQAIEMRWSHNKKTDAYQIMITECPANKEPVKGTNAKSLLMTIFYKAIFP